MYIREGLEFSKGDIRKAKLIFKDNYEEEIEMSMIYKQKHDALYLLLRGVEYFVPVRVQGVFSDVGNRSKYTFVHPNTIEDRHYIIDWNAHSDMPIIEIAYGILKGFERVENLCLDDYFNTIDILFEKDEQAKKMTQEKKLKVPLPAFLDPVPRRARELMEKRVPAITKVLFNDPATIVFWSDNTKTVVKTQNGEKFDPEKGLAMAISKKALGNERSYYHTFKRWTKKYKPIDRNEIVVENFNPLVAVAEAFKSAFEDHNTIFGGENEEQ